MLQHIFCLGPLSDVAQTCDVGGAVTEQVRESSVNFVCEPCLILSNRAMLRGAVTVPGQRRESSVNFLSSESSVVYCAGGGSMV